MSCDGNCNASETAMFMNQSRLEGYEEGLELGRAEMSRKMDILRAVNSALKFHVEKFQEHNAKLQTMIRDMLTCNFTQDKCSECYGKAQLLISEENPT